MESLPLQETVNEVVTDLQQNLAKFVDDVNEMATKDWFCRKNEDDLRSAPRFVSTIISGEIQKLQQFQSKLGSPPVSEKPKTSDVAEFQRQIQTYNEAEKAYVASIQELQEKVEHEKRAKNEALTRLSEIAGHRFHKDNPDIADLSDTNRPTKIGEQLSELYDERWTDAFEEQKQKVNFQQRQTTGKLMTTLLDAYQFCEEIADKQLKDIQQSLLKSLQENVQENENGSYVLEHFTKTYQKPAPAKKKPLPSPKPKDKTVKNDPRLIPPLTPQRSLDIEFPETDINSQFNSVALRKKETSQKNGIIDVQSIPSKTSQEPDSVDYYKDDENPYANAEEAKEARASSSDDEIDHRSFRLSTAKVEIPESCFSDESERLAKQLQKSCAVDSIPYVQQLFLSKKICSNSQKMETNLKAYILQCVEVCWLMVVQDPPLVMVCDVEPDTRFTRSTWKEYTRTGKTIEYIVWPALLLHKEGPVLAKGVAELKQEDKNAPQTEKT